MGNVWPISPRNMTAGDILAYVYHRFGQLFVEFCRQHPAATLPSGAPADARASRMSGDFTDALCGRACGRACSFVPERAADPLNRGGVNPKPNSNLADALSAPWLVQGLTDSFF